MSRVVPLQELGSTITDIVTEWSAEVVVLVEEAQEEAIENARKDIKKMTAKESVARYRVNGDGGTKKVPQYINCYAKRKNVISDHSHTLYNRKYQLSHLLEDGHVVRNQYSDKINPRTGKMNPHTWEIRRRTATKLDNRKIVDNLHTAKFTMWRLEGDPAAEDYIKRALEKIRKYSK